MISDLATQADGLMPQIQLNLYPKCDLFSYSGAVAQWLLGWILQLFNKVEKYKIIKYSAGDLAESKKKKPEVIMGKEKT